MKIKLYSMFKQLFILPLALVCLVVFVGCSNESEAKPSEKKMGMMAMNVVGFKSLKQDIRDTIFIVGSLESNESVEIKSEINGVVDNIQFNEGALVKKGDILFQIEREKLKASYDQSIANLKLAETTAQRYKNLVQSKAVSQQEYDQTVASLESNRATVALSKEQLEDATIKAPFDGVMGERLISEGQFVSQGTSLTFLFNKDPMKAVFHVPERYMGQVKNGLDIKLKVAAYKEEVFNGAVYFVDPKLNDVTRTALIKAKVPNQDGRLFEGMFANLELVLNVKKDAIVIPETALIIKGNDVSVYVVGDDDVVSLKQVTVGKRFEGMVEVTTGLKEDETVVVEGYQKIGPGSKVKVRFEDKSESQMYEII